MKSFKTTDTIDFEPATVAAVVSRDEYIAVELPAQPCYSQAVYDDPSSAPYYSCEMQVLDGNIELLKVVLSFETESWEVKFNGGTRACFLPHNFSAEGPIVLSFYENDSENPAIVISGKQFSLKVLEDSEVK